jgi:ABC-type multidrug transport system fused ATPase/permease subunit
VLALPLPCVKAVFKILSYVKEFKGYILLNFIFNLGYILLQLLTLLLVMPVLKFLFQSDDSAFSTARDKMGSGNWFSTVYSDAVLWFKELVAADRFTALFYLCIALVVITLIKNACRYLALYFIVILRNKAIRSVRLKVFHKVVSLPVSYFSNERKGDLMSRMSNDMKEIEWAMMVSLEALYKDPVNIVIFLTTLILMSWKLTLYVLVTLPVAALLIGVIARTLRKKSTKNQEQAGHILSMMEETLGGIRIIKGFVAESFVKKRYEKDDQDYTRLNIAVSHRYDLASPMSETLGFLVSAVLLWFGGGMVFRGELEPEFFIAYFGIFSQLIPPFKGFSQALYSAQRGMAGLMRVEEILHAPLEVTDPQHPLPAPQFHEGIEFRNVCFSYGNKSVLRNINLHVRKGEMVALVGASGAGKTTLADLVPRFYDVREGTILLDGHDIRAFRQEDLRGLMGIVAQESILFNDTVYQNITFGMQGVGMKEVEAAARMANAHEFIMQLPEGYESNIGDRGGKLSGGQKQRLSIARAVLRNPEILILDEATSALDTESEKLVQEALDKLMKHRTSIVIAHRLSTVTHADRIVVLQQGEIVETGRHDELMALNGTYAKLIRLQQL